MILAYWPVLCVLAAALIGYGDLLARVKRLQRDVDAKASKELLDAHFNEIIRRLDRIENGLERRVRREDM